MTSYCMTSYTSKKVGGLQPSSPPAPACLRSTITSAVKPYIMQYYTILHHNILHYFKLYNTILHYIILYYTITLVPNQRVADWCRSVDQLIPGRTKISFLFATSIAMTKPSIIVKAFAPSSLPGAMNFLRSLHGPRK